MHQAGTADRDMWLPRSVAFGCPAKPRCFLCIMEGIFIILLFARRAPRL